MYLTYIQLYDILCNMKTKNTSKIFSLTETFDKKVKRLTLTMQDAPIYKSPEDKDTLVGQAATIFGTLQVFTDDNKKVKNINFTFPLNFNKELKAHILAIIDEALKLSDKSK